MIQPKEILLEMEWRFLFLFLNSLIYLILLLFDD